MEQRLREIVRKRAENACEYCHIPQKATPLIAFHVEHIVSKQHGGTDDLESLALACDRCNAYKGPNLASIDPETSTLVVFLVSMHGAAISRCGVGMVLDCHLLDVQRQVCST